MANSYRDANRVPTITGVSSLDLQTPTNIAVNPSTGAVLIDGTSLYATIDSRYLKLDSSNDPITGNLLVQPIVDSLTGFVVNDTDANTILNVDTINNMVGIGTTLVGLKLNVSGTYGNPASSGTSQLGSVRIGGAFDSNVLDVGNQNGTPFGSWLQSTNRLNLSTYYSLLINPRGGNVGIGTFSPGQQFHVASAGTREGYSTSAVFSDTTDITKGVFIGYNSTADYGLIAASDQGQGWKKLILQPVQGDIGIGTIAPEATVDIHSNVDEVVLQLQGHSTQTNNLQEWKDSAGTILSHVNPNGSLDIGVAIGTPPITVTSTTMNTNLNADSVDGYHSASIFKDNDVVMNTNPFAGRKLFINSLNNAYFRADKRWVVTASQYRKSDNSLVSAYTATAISYLFNGSYEESFIILAGNYAIININFSPELGGYYPNYPYGNFYLSHYSTSFPLAAVTNTDTLRVYCNYAPQGIGWHTMSFADFIRTNVLITKAGNQFYQISQAEFKINANDTVARNLSEIDVQLDRPGPNEMPIIDKFKQNILYDGLSFENGTYASMIYLNPSGYSWINGGNVGIGTNNPQTKLSLSVGSAISFEASAGVTDIALTHTADTLTFTGGTIVLGTATATGGLTGNITGNASGTAATVTGAAQASITTAVNLPWTGLKSGVDGEIPTFDASGNPAFVAVGTATHVLTSNGAGAAPTFQAVGAGAGDVIGPATNTADYIPQWNGANSKTLKDGLAVPAGGIAGLTALADKAPIASPTFTGTPSAPTAGAGTSTTQLATTEFVQVAVRSSPGKEASEYATIAALPAIVYANGSSGVGATLTGVAVGALGVDSQSPAVGNRILVKNQVSTFQNGIYTVTATGSGIAVFVLTRALDFNQQTDILTGAATYVVGGTTLTATTWDVNSADSPVIGTDAITFVQSAGPGSMVAGNGVTITGTSIAINTAVTADLTSTQTFTNKTHTSPKINEDVVMTASATELNVLDGIPATLTATELGYVDGVTSAIQTQLSGKQASGTYSTDIHSNITALSAVSGTNTGDNSANTTYAIGSQTQAYNSNLTAINQALTTTSSPSFTTVTAALTGTASGNLTSANIEDNITDGHTTVAPSGNAVFDALALKAPLTSPTFATSITGSYLTASQILGTDGSKNIVSLAVATYPSLTELSYVKGLSSAIQTQIDAKGVGTVTGSGTTNELSYWTSASAQGTLAVATYPSLTEVSYVKGLTSSAQTQITARLPLAGGTMSGNIILGAGVGTDLTLPTTDAQCTGNYTDSFQSGYTASAGDLVFYGSGGKWLEVDSDAVATCKGLIGIAMEAKNDTQAMKVALPGSMVHFDAWTWTVADTLYAGETLGAIQNAIPTGADGVIKVIGFAIDADTIFFNPSPDQQSTVA